ncbi:cation:proton antiporter [Noviherbaspirillum sp.]|uniref:cation:proton antiporter n=1 Tax=Noviherbaspirillum sp. TaxID=1926288 RepID=UPI002D586CE0|nr:monovalent cation/H(+) antiporter subunit G [Noviherbaspirillum sp.]HZW22710.1 monovalent cation/H(+) antiporter subunit G [Noviherbaspirillum sp.]
MSIIDWISAACLLAGAGFFFAGTVALLRFPDVYTRLHALAKADNLGLGFMLLGLLPYAGGTAAALKLVLVWLLVLAASASVSFLIARRARRRKIPPWTSQENA